MTQPLNNFKKNSNVIIFWLCVIVSEISINSDVLHVLCDIRKIFTRFVIYVSGCHHAANASQRRSNMTFDGGSLSMSYQQ